MNWSEAVKHVVLFWDTTTSQSRCIYWSCPLWTLNWCLFPLTFDLCSVRWPSVLADGALPRSRPEHHLRRIGLLTFRWSEVKRVQDQELADRLWMFDFLLRRFGAWRPFMWPRPLLPYTPPVFPPPLTLLPSDNPPRVLGQLKTTAHMTSVWKKELSAAFEGQRIWEMTLWLCPRAWQQNIIASLNSLQTLSALRCPWCAVLVP